MTALQPTGLRVDLLRHPVGASIHAASPLFSWVVNADTDGAFQHAYHILVASESGILARDEGDCWDSGAPIPGEMWATDSQSVAVAYSGERLKNHTEYYWKVRTWLSASEVSPWSETQRFETDVVDDARCYPSNEPVVTRVFPSDFVSLPDNRTFIDFGRAAFGTIEMTVDVLEANQIEIRLGEVQRQPYVLEENPGGSRRFQVFKMDLVPGSHTYRLTIPSDERNTGDFAIKMPESLFEVYPFRFCEVRHDGVHLDRDSVVQLAVHYPFDDTASHFSCSNPVLNDVWDFCKYTMKATSFCGLYIDGDRERVPYEADSYINQLGHYACDSEYAVARRTLSHLMEQPTWPTEWFLYAILIAWNDYMFTGDASFISQWYDDLKHKSLIDASREDGLISSENITEHIEEKIYYAGTSKKFFGRGVTDIVDWPQVERDGHEMCRYNSVVNALHYRALACLVDIASYLGKRQDEVFFRERAALVKMSFQRVFVEEGTRLVLDGEGSRHSSLHSNVFALACGLVPKTNLGTVLHYVRAKGMSCSVYASQMVLEALYLGGDGDYALSVLSGTGERSWAHMFYDLKSTIALEAWDDRLKPNQDWNHAWGAAPASMIPFGLMGIRPLEPGFAKVMIDPQPGNLRWAEVTVPTIRGGIDAAIHNEPGERFALECTIPSNMTAAIGLPSYRGAHAPVILDGHPVFPQTRNARLYLHDVLPGRHVVVV